MIKITTFRPINNKKSHGDTDLDFSFQICVTSLRMRRSASRLHLGSPDLQAAGFARSQRRGRGRPLERREAVAPRRHLAAAIGCVTAVCSASGGRIWQRLSAAASGGMS